MPLSRMRSVVLASLAAAGFAACAGTTPSTPSTAATRPSPSDPDAAAIEALYRARLDSARNRYTPDDVRFVSGMIGHHAQALVMSRLAPTHGASPVVRTLAARIINAQQDEIALMSAWLRDRDEVVPEIHITGTTLMVHGAEHALHMPGMLTQAQLDELDAATGVDFDRLFLTFMIQHHRGAVTMVHDLFATDGAAQGDQLFKLASDIQVDQITEIARMELMLSALSPKGAAPPAVMHDS